MKYNFSQQESLFSLLNFIPKNCTNQRKCEIKAKTTQTVSRKWKFAMEKGTLVVIGDQKSISDITQFHATIEAHRPHIDNGQLWLLFERCKCKRYKGNYQVKKMQSMWLCILSGRRFEETFENAQWRKIKQMHPMWLCLFSGKQFEDTYENAQWGKAKQMQPMWLCLFSGRRFEETFKNTQWRKVKQMQPMWLCLCSCRRFEETFENAQWRKAKQMQPVWLCILSGRRFEKTFENTWWR